MSPSKKCRQMNLRGTIGKLNGSVWRQESSCKIKKKKKNCRKLRTEDGNPKGEKNLCVMLSSKDYLEDTVVIHKIIEQDI